MRASQIALVAMATAVISSTGADAQSRRRSNPGPDFILGLDGQCEKLVVEGDDHTPDCSGKILNTSYQDGRSGFYFVTKSGAAITFSGLGGNQVKMGADRAIQPIDMVLFAFEGESEKLRAVGSCDFENPYKGKSRIVCSATTKRGAYEGRFASDGAPPKTSYQRR
jgi:hypothetical protein